VIGEQFLFALLRRNVMAGIEDLLTGALGGGALSKIAAQLGTDEAGARSAVGAALPKMVGRLQQNASSDDGAQALSDAINRDHDGSVLDGVDDHFDRGDSDGMGSKILGKVFGADRDGVEDELAQETGLDKSKAAGLMGMLAPVLLGSLGRAGASQGGVSPQGLSGMLGGLMGGGGGAGGGMGALLGGLLGGGGAGGALGALGGLAGGGGGAKSGPLGAVTNMLDRDKDGSIIDDVQDMARSGLGQKILGFLRRR
jgi:hypothetical protein